MIETVITPTGFDVTTEPSGNVVLIAHESPTHRVLFVLDVDTAGRVGDALKAGGSQIALAGPDDVQALERIWRPGMGPKPR